MAGASASEHIRLRTSTFVPPNTIFVWLNTWSEDFNKLKQQFCKETSTSPRNWKFYDNKDNCSHFIRQTETKENIVLISSGRLGLNVVSSLHDLPQLHSVYIYCTKTDRYESLKDDYKKVRGVFNDPVQLFDKLCENLDEEARRSQSNISIASDIVPKQKNPDVILHCLFHNEIRSYYTPNISWCPWQTNSCSVLLPSKGQGTIELWLSESIPFELCISNRQNPTDNDANSYAIVLKADTREALLGTISAQHGHVMHIRDSTTEFHQVLQLSDNHWHCYWFTFYSTNRVVQYGIGEIRPKFKILETPFQQRDKTSLESLSYLHIKLNNNSNVNGVAHLKDKLKIFIGAEPIIFDPPLLIISPNAFSPTHPANNNGVLAHLLENQCRNLYHEIIHFTLNDESFPSFIETIERSISNPDGWCHRKLKEKVRLFGRPRMEATYLCIAVDRLETGKIRYPCLIKIWPPGHYSPIHNHGDAYGIIRILYGKLLVKFFSALSINLRQNPLIEQLFQENQVTWMMPKLNQTHEMKNPDMYGSCCITIQCCQYETDDQVQWERFDYIPNDEYHIKHYQCIPDDNYLAFKKTMKMESIPETAV